MSTTPSSKVRRRRISLVIALAVLVALVLLSAFVWPHWAVKGQEPGGSSTASQSQEQTKAKPKVTASPLPQDASELLKAMPDTVANFARIKAERSTEWGSKTPIEEYSLVYSKGDPQKEVTLHLAQWSKAEEAKQVYDSLTSTLTGKELASGRVKADGNSTGSYVEKEVEGEPKTAQAIWQNDTVVFQAQGSKSALESFYKAFPL